MKTGGQLIVDALEANGVDRVYCVPGESYLAVLDALADVRDRIEVIACRSACRTPRPCWPPPPHAGRR